MTRLACLTALLVAASGAVRADPATSEPDDSDLPKPFKPLDAGDKGSIPAFLGIFGPVELIEKAGFTSSPGKWIEYELVPHGAVGVSEHSMRIQEVGPSPRGSRWIEMIVKVQGTGTAGIRMLVKGERDGNIERVIAKAPDMPPIEFPVGVADAASFPMAGMRKADGTRGGVLTRVGQEKVKVPLGTFLCDHWVLDNGDRKYDLWLATDTSIPFTRAIKFTTDEGVALARAVGNDATGVILVPGPRR